MTTTLGYLYELARDRWRYRGMRYHPFPRPKRRFPWQIEKDRAHADDICLYRGQVVCRVCGAPWTPSHQCEVMEGWNV